MKLYYDKDADPAALRGKRIAIIGYGSQGFGQANNLRDSGCDVIIGLRPDGRTRAKAERAGFSVLPIAEAAQQADIVMMLVPDEVAPEVYEQCVAGRLRAGACLGFSHGFAIHYGFIKPPSDVGVFMVAPKGPGHLVRREYTRGAGVPCLLAVHQDPTGDVRRTALAYAVAIGGGRAGIIETTFREETETDLFGEQAVLCGGLTSLIKAGFETLVEAGYAPEIAYFECLHELKLIVDLIQEGGLSYMRYSVSDTAEYGDYTRGPRVINHAVRREMRRLLEEVQSGQFAREWIEEFTKNGLKNFLAMREAARNQPLEVVGRELRQMMPFLRKQKETGVPEEQSGVATG